jgi:hypothetical protein
MHPSRILLAALFLALMILAVGFVRAVNSSSPPQTPVDERSSMEDGFIRRFKDPTVDVTCWVIDGNPRTTAISCLPNKSFME